MIEPTPVVISLIGLTGTILVGFWASHGNKKTEKRISEVPSTLVQEFARMNPGVDTVEKVIELLYTEIERLKDDGIKKDERIDKLVKEKGELLDELQSLKRKLDYLEARIKKSISKDA